MDLKKDFSRLVPKCLLALPKSEFGEHLCDSILKEHMKKILIV